MNYNLINNIQSCYIDLPDLLYYSHIPAIIISLFIGLYVFYKSRNLQSKILLLVSLVFSLWASLNLVLWISTSGRIIVFAWSFFGIVYSLLYIFSLYFVYVFIDKKDISFVKKTIFGILLIPIIFFTSTKYNIEGFDSVSCNALDQLAFFKNFNFYFSDHYQYLGLFIFLWMIAVVIKRYSKANDKTLKREILLLSIGIALFLFTFFAAGYLVGELVDRGILLNYDFEYYSLFGMLVFMAFLAYLIVRYKAFNIRLLATNALVTALVILIGSELFFAEKASNQILILITLAISLGFGYILIKSVRSEVERKEQLQMMSDKLAQANDQLRKLDNAKTEFISIASHQLRTPLTAIKGFISLLLEGSYGPLQKEHQDVLNKVYTSNERLINLAEDLLNISRIESGRMEYDFKKWDIVKMCSELVDTFVMKAKDRGLYLDYKKPEQALPEVMTDGGKLREVISNLIDNAIKYSQKGGVTLRLEEITNDKNSKLNNSNVIRVIVSDTGIGIPKEELPYLFAKFSRGKDTTRLNTGGTGLGLYVGRSIMEAIGGKIWAESEGAGKGSQFIVEVPVEHSF